MPRTPTEDSQLLEHLSEVFREHGYEGASLSLISDATGLGRASLYHHFPGGKAEMALAVLRHIDGRLASEVLSPLSQTGKPETRVRKVAERLTDFYMRGTFSCLLDTLSLGDPNTELRAAVKASFEGLLEAFAKVSREAGLAPSQAKRRAADAVIRIQGSVVMARATGDTKPFLRTMKGLPQLLTSRGDR
ncbi:MAG: TetR/AcrR family transcriptional regulator [Planctomycetota bacterium]